MRVGPRNSGGFLLDAAHLAEVVLGEGAAMCEVAGVGEVFLDDDLELSRFNDSQAVIVARLFEGLKAGCKFGDGEGGLIIGAESAGVYHVGVANCAPHPRGRDRSKTG